MCTSVIAFSAMNNLEKEFCVFEGLQNWIKPVWNILLSCVGVKI